MLKIVAERWDFLQKRRDALVGGVKGMWPPFGSHRAKDDALARHRQPAHILGKGAEHAVFVEILFHIRRIECADRVAVAAK